MQQVWKMDMQQEQLAIEQRAYEFV